MLFDLHIYFLTTLNIEDGKWGTTLADLVQNLGVVGVVQTQERTVIDGEPVCPEVEAALDLLTWRCLLSGRVFDHFTGRVVAPQRSSGAFEVRRRLAGLISAWTGHVPATGKLSLCNGK